MRQFLGQGMRVAAVACVGGLALSVAFTRVLPGMLYGVSPSDPATLLSVVAIVLAVATLAALIPAAPAAFLQPMRALRGVAAPARARKREQEDNGTADPALRS